MIDVEKNGVTGGRGEAPKIGTYGYDEFGTHEPILSLEGVTQVPIGPANPREPVDAPKDSKLGREARTIDEESER
jgi:hypothetical protein